MAKIHFIFSISLGITLLGCKSIDFLDFGNRPTQINPLPVKTALKDSAVVIAFPLEVQKKPTGGYRSLLDLQLELMLTEPAGIDVPLIPNGFVLGLRGRR
jgi:hypothetical protein